MSWIIIGPALAIFIYIIFIKPLNYWKSVGAPQYPFWITLQETFLGIVQYRSMIDSVHKLYSDFPEKRYVGIYQFYRPLLVLRDPDLVKQITIKDFDHFVDHMTLIAENGEPLWEKNLFALKGDKWRAMRSTLSPSFTGSKMKIIFTLISECAKQVVCHFEEQNSKVLTVEMKDIFSRFTNDVIASSAFGVTCDSIRNRDNDFYLMGKTITDFKGIWNSFRILCIALMPNICKTIGITFLDKNASTFFRKLVEEHIQVRENEGIIRQDMLHLLMEARKERLKNDDTIENVGAVDDSSNIKDEIHQLSKEDIIAQALLFFFAGFESVATLMCFMAYELAFNPDIQDRLQREVDDVLKDGGGSLTYEALSKMKYMDKVVLESLRKWPTVFITDRVCAKSYTIPPSENGKQPVHLKKGDALWIPIFEFHRDPLLYPEPERFDPERFDDENKSSITPYTFMPFGSGPRTCIGNRFALMETKLVFFYILSKFNITVTEKTPVPLVLSKAAFQLTAEGGFWLGLKSRKMD